MILMIFDILIIHNHHRMLSITSDLHTATWKFFTTDLPHRFGRSPKVVKEAIMTDIDDLAQDLCRTSNDGTVGAPFFEMRRLLEILQKCIGLFEVCFDIVYFDCS